MSGAWRRTRLVARREWNQRARSLAFRISTLVSILIVVALILVPEMYGGGVKPTETVGLAGQSSAELPAVLHAAGDQLGVTVETRSFAVVSEGRAALRSGEVGVLLVDQRDLVWNAEPDDRLQTIVTSSVQVVDQREAIADLGLTPEQAERLLAPPQLGSSSLEPDSDERAARVGLAIIALVLLFMTLAFYGGFVLTGVVEEKSSRVVEVLLSRLRPTELLSGKVLGIGLVGLAQFALVAAAAMVTLRLSGTTLAPDTTPGTIGWVVFWFVLGYAFYSVLYATAGSLVSRQEEAQTIQLPITTVLLVAYLLSFGAAESPDSTIAVLGSLFPPTAPMVMTVRIANGGVPSWQIALSIALMVASSYFLMKLAGRIYAGAVLRFGGRVRLREAWRGGEA